MVEVGRHHHPVPGRVRQLRALGRHTLRHAAPAAAAVAVVAPAAAVAAAVGRQPGAVVADHAGAGAGLELGDAGDRHRLVVA